MNWAYQLRFLIGLAITLVYSYAAFEYKWDMSEPPIEVFGCVEIEVEDAYPPLPVYDEEHIPITYQEPYKPEFEELTHEELEENLQYIETEIEEEEECDPEKQFKLYETEEPVAEICGTALEEELEERFEEDTDEVFLTIIQDVPKPVGGMKALYQFLKKELKYPEALRSTGIEGKVFIRFIVKKDGSLTCFDIVRGLHPLLDEEALRVMMALPKWEPATARGKPIDQVVCFPIRFKL